MRIPEPSVDLLERLDVVNERLVQLADLPPAEGFTDPDPPTGERWEWGQVWAHLAEFPSYWMDQIRHVISTGPDEVPPFGRVKSDPVRVGAIERDRDVPAGELMARVQAAINDLRAMLQELTPEDWERRVAHPTLGTLDMAYVFDRFLVGHLEEHAAQLEGLATG